MSSRPSAGWFEYLPVQLLVLVAVCVVSLWSAWIGFVASDDEYYVMSALGWREHFPYVAEHFGTIRASVAIPMALVIAVLGESEWSLSLAAALTLFAVAAVTMYMLNGLLSRGAALITSVLLLTAPIYALKSTTPNADVPELFFVILSFWLFWRACVGPAWRGWLLASGLSAGLAFSAHELSAALMIFYGMLFLRGYRMPRLRYGWILVGFAAVIAAECLYYAVAAGNPLHRFELLLRGVAASHDRVEVGFLQIASGGTLHVWGPIDPVVMLLTHHNFSLIGWVAVPAVMWLLGRGWHDEAPAPALARLALGMAVTWTVFNTYMLREIILLPRYYMVTAYFLVLVSAVWLARAVWPRRPKTVVAIIVAVLLTNMLCVAVDNKNPKFAQRALVDYLKHSSGTVYTDPLTADDTDWYCRWAGVDCGRIVTTPPGEGAVYFWNPRNTAEPNRFVKQDALPAYRPAPAWEKISTIEGEPMLIGRALRITGLASRVPERVLQRVTSPNPPAHLYVVHN